MGVACVVALLMGCSEQPAVQLDDFKGKWVSDNADLRNVISFEDSADVWVIHSFLVDVEDTLFSENYLVSGDSLSSVITLPDGQKLPLEYRRASEMQFRTGDELIRFQLASENRLVVVLNNSRREPYELSYRRADD